jgi:PAS domain S-box-containing protein
MFKIPAFFNRHCKMTQYAVFVIAYFATGKLGIFLAVPPGYATAIFPPSGIALAGILLLGYRAWFSVLLGSFLLNLSIAASHAPIENYISVVMAFIIAVGATLQAILGAYLVKNFANFPNPLASERNVFKFIFYGGILSTLVNSTISVSTLVAMNQVPVSNFFNNWSTWWLGDAIGIFIFAPLTLVWFYRKHDYFYNRKHTVTFTILSAFLLTVMLVVFETHKESERLKSEFDKGVLTLNRALDKSIAEHLLTLRSLESFYAASGNVQRDAFHQFTANTLKEFKGIQALEWCPIIKNAEREAFEKSVQKEGFLNFEITERNENQKLVRAKEREFYAPITFVEPFKSNELTLGYSANINERHEAMEIARDTGDIVTSAKFVLLQSNRVGILVIAPIYKQHLPHDSLQERRQNILGYVQAVFHVDDILQNALKGANFEKLHLELFDENAPASEHLLFSNQLSTFVLNEKGLFGKNLALTSSTVIPIGNRQWRFKITPTQDYFAYHYSNNAWLILLSGLVLTSVIGVFIMVSSGRELVLQELVNNRTNDLAKSEAHFRSIIEISPVPLALNDNQQNILFLNSTFIRTFGYDLNDIPTLNEWWDKAYPDPNYRQWVLDTWATTLEQCKTENKVFPPLEFVICCKNGMQRTVLISPSALGDSFETHLVVLYDITERKNMETELKRSNSDLEQFAYAISHDMRQPLRMVTSYLSLIEKALDKQLDEDTRQFLDFAVDGAKRIDSMILSLLDYSRVGRNTHAASLISSRAAVDEALLFLQPALESCQGRLEITGDWIELVANRDELTRLFQNLIGNALKYQDGIKTPVVEISASVTANTFRVDVRDNGIGIEPTQIDRLFKVFSRLQARSHFEGTGVGLALCRKIIEHHCGTIGVESAGEGYGCTFWFELPRKSIGDVNV